MVAPTAVQMPVTGAIASKGARLWTPRSLRYAIRTLRNEVLDFRFAYPLDLVPEAGPRESLHYYLYSERLRWTVRRLDDSGIPVAHRRILGKYYRPGLCAWWGLVNLGHYLRHKDQPSLNAFVMQLGWLERNAMLRADRSVVWPNLFNSREGNLVLRAPWISAYDQGLAISALVRGYRLTGSQTLLKLLHNAAMVFEKSTAEGGLRVLCETHTLYTELPGGSVPGILDGFMTSLIGLYDLFVETEDSSVLKLFREGIDGLKYTLPQWDYRGRWSWYGSRA